MVEGIDIITMFKTLHPGMHFQFVSLQNTLPVELNWYHNREYLI